MKVLLVLVLAMALQAQAFHFFPEARKYIRPSGGDGKKPGGGSGNNGTDNGGTGNNGSGNNGSGNGGTDSGSGSDSGTNGAPPTLPFNVLSYFVNNPRQERGGPAMTTNSALQEKAQKCADFYQIGKEVTKNTKDEAELEKITPCDSFVDMESELDMWYVGGCDAPSQVTMIQDWLKEESDYDYEKPDVSQVAKFGHFSQLMWKETGSFACAISKKPIESGGDSSKPEETKPDETKPDETKPDETKPDETKPDETKPDESKPDETKPDETKPDETKPDETKPDETKPDETKPDETKPDETKPDETKPDASKDDSKTDESKEKQCIHTCMFDKGGNIVVNGRNTMFKSQVLPKKK